jgi:hypothetical protein
MGERKPSTVDKILDLIDRALDEYDEAKRNFAYLDDPYALAARRGVIGAQFV